LRYYIINLFKEANMSLPSLSLEDRVAVVTGARRGIGRSIALLFAEAGANVAVCDCVIEDGELESVAEEIQRFDRRSLAIKADISQEGDVDNLVKRVVDEFDGIDILVNNAGILGEATTFEAPLDDWDKIMDTNLKGYYVCSRAAGRRMIEQKRGNIISMASVASFRAGEFSGVYNVTKAGVVMLTRVLAKYLGSHNIRVNAIAPSLVPTDLYPSWLAQGLWKDPDGLARLEASTALGRLPTAEEISNVALFFASDASSFITGHTILVDGGALA
jgi:NAD(P)-dependent dehydrogenase (short-subunit alcohol dehydrogenase family)